MGTAQQLLTFVFGSVAFSLILRSIYRVYFHPLSKYPGPKIAAISDVWYAYHSLAGRWPWAVESALKKYGDVVRIAPNELVFVTPKALADLYGSHNKNQELFPKTQINNHGNDEHGGLIWEWDPVRHRQVARRLSPAFKGSALKAKEPTLHRYIDLFVERMKTLGGRVEGVSLPTWINWLCVDISADMAYNREMNALKDMKTPPYLSLLSGFNKALVVIQMSWRFPFLSPLKYLILFTTMRPHSHIRDHSREQLERRIRRKGSALHLDFFEQIIPEDREPPKDRKELRHLEQVAGQLLVAGYEPPALWFYFTIYYLLKNPDILQTLTDEIRGAFKAYDDITSDTAASLTYLTASLKESLRVMPGVLTGMPVVSPGALVDGTFIPKGVICQSSSFALARSRYNFHKPLDFRPERWLPKQHPLYDPQFADDNCKGFQPFSQGPRMCAGREIAWWQSRLFIAKVLWTFDLEMVSGQNINMDKDLRGWGMYEKPEVRVRFVPAVHTTRA
ncbi:cytochrome P450 [Daldinia decipiens]|uniref:cytochrome P450 n=1 Tax=Daldinia decipiens TaxID=326647 RepID=UPI0020C2E864|nr:cytochrome P450 [Daldinia decipiens]KAI1661697.1 cytochrome P450 [Daldinia decipiens]